MSKKHKGPKGNMARTIATALAASAAGEAAAQDATTVTAETVVENAGTPEAKAVPGVCKVKEGAKLRGAREAWYQRLLAFQGKPLAEYMAACEKEPPSLPKNGKAEKPSGWVSWFKREGLLQVEAPSKPVENTAEAA